jgi:hypothetical protein
MLHKIFNNDDRASLVHMGIAIPSVLNIIGFVMMQFPEEIPSIGHNLTYASAMALYVVVGIVVWSLYLTPDLRTSKCIALYVCLQRRLLALQYLVHFHFRGMTLFCF